MREALEDVFSTLSLKPSEYEALIAEAAYQRGLLDAVLICEGQLLKFVSNPYAVGLLQTTGAGAAAFACDQCAVAILAKAGQGSKERRDGRTDGGAEAGRLEAQFDR